MPAQAKIPYHIPVTLWWSTNTILLCSYSNTESCAITFKRINAYRRNPNSQTNADTILGALPELVSGKASGKVNKWKPSGPNEHICSCGRGICISTNASNPTNKTHKSPTQLKGHVWEPFVPKSRKALLQAPRWRCIAQKSSNKHKC